MFLARDLWQTWTCKLWSITILEAAFVWFWKSAWLEKSSRLLRNSPRISAMQTKFASGATGASFPFEPLTVFLPREGKSPSSLKASPTAPFAPPSSSAFRSKRSSRFTPASGGLTHSEFPRFSMLRLSDGFSSRFVVDAVVLVLVCLLSLRARLLLRSSGERWLPVLLRVGLRGSAAACVSAGVKADEPLEGGGRKVNMGYSC